MDRIPVESSTVVSAGYDASTSTLELEFTSGALYDYFAVPRSTFERFLAAESKGQFFSQHIRGVYPFSRNLVTSPPWGPRGTTTPPASVASAPS
jgi:hypothetical protein